MPLRPLLPAILLALVMSIIVGVLAAGRGSGMTLALAVALFALQLLFAAVRVNGPAWRGENGDPPQDEDAIASVWRNAVLAGFVYAWGATALLAIYSLSGLTWRHWWQYGAAMALVAAGIFIYANMLASRPALRTPRPLEALMALTATQGIAVIVGLVYLVFWGKLASPRSDWAANHIFAGGCIMLALLSLISILTYRKLGQHVEAA